MNAVSAFHGAGAANGRERPGRGVRPRADHGGRILHTEQRRRGRRLRSPFFVIFPNSINWDNYLLGIRPYFTLLNLYVLFDFSQYG